MSNTDEMDIDSSAEKKQESEVKETEDELKELKGKLKKTEVELEQVKVELEQVKGKLEVLQLKTSPTEDEEKALSRLEGRYDRLDERYNLLLKKEEDLRTDLKRVRLAHPAPLPEGESSNKKQKVPKRWFGVLNHEPDKIEGEFKEVFTPFPPKSSLSLDERASLEQKFSSFTPLAEFKAGEFINLTPSLLRDLDYDDMNETILRATNRPSVLVRPQLANIFLSAGDSQRRAKVIRGVAGGGKTVNLVALGHECRRAGSLVIFLKGKDLASDMFRADPNAHARVWIRRHLMVDLNRFLLDRIPCSFSPTHSLLDLLHFGLSRNDQAFAAMFLFLRDVPRIEGNYILLAFDQYNALLTPEQLEDNPFSALLFGDWNRYFLVEGLAVFAYSSAFSAEKKAEDGNGAAEVEPTAFRLEELTTLLQRWRMENAITTPPDFDRYVTDVMKTTNGLPRAVGWLCIIANGWHLDRALLDEYASRSRRYFYSRFERVLTKLEAKLLNDSLDFAARLYIGETLTDIPSSWANAGLMTKNADRHWVLPTPQAYPAFFEVFKTDIAGHGAPYLNAMKLWLNDSNVRWRGLELAVIHRLRLSSVSNLPLRIPKYDLTLTESKDQGPLTFTVQRMITLESSPAEGVYPRVEPGDVVVLWRGAAVIDVFVYSTTRQRIFIQVSESAYTDHHTKLPDLFTSRAVKDVSVYDFFCRCIDPSHVTTTAPKKPPLLPKDDFYVYFTTSRQVMMKKNKAWSSEVLVLGPSSFDTFLGPSMAECITACLPK